MEKLCGIKKIRNAKTHLVAKMVLEYIQKELYIQNKET